MNENLLRLVLPALKTENSNDGGDMGLILPLVLSVIVKPSSASRTSR